MLAIKNGHVEIVDLLLMYGADLHQGLSVSGDTVSTLLKTLKENKESMPAYVRIKKLIDPFVLKEENERLQDIIGKQTQINKEQAEKNMELENKCRELKVKLEASTNEINKLKQRDSYSILRENQSQVPQESNPTSKRITDFFKKM